LWLLLPLIIVGGRIKNVNDTVELLDKKVNLINVPMRTRGGDVVLMPAGVAMDYLIKNKNMEKVKNF